MPTTYLNCAATAKLLRKALAEAFPRVKFSVTSKTYSGGASITVRWTDGPNSKQVDEVSQAFAGSYFDGSTDYKGSNYHTLDGEPVSFGADFIFSSREHSDAAVARALSAACRLYGVTGTVAEFRNGSLYRTPIAGATGWDAHWNLQDEVNRRLHKHSDRLAVAPSPTLDRVLFTGDDGYGQGTVGRSFRIVAPNTAAVLS